MIDITNIKPEANSLVIIRSPLATSIDALRGIADAILKAYPSVTVLYLDMDESIEVIDLFTAKSTLENLLLHSE